VIGKLLTTGMPEAVEPDAPIVPAGAWFNAIYPKYPVPPQNSLYPGHSVLQSPEDDVTPGA